MILYNKIDSVQLNLILIKGSITITYSTTQVQVRSRGIVSSLLITIQTAQKKINDGITLANNHSNYIWQFEIKVKKDS